MNSLTRCVLAPCLLLSAVLAHSAADPGAAIADCRARYAANPPEHIACLERELKSFGAAPEQAAQPGLGAEQLKTNRPQESVEQIAVQIANATYGFDGMGVFRMTDGQVWKATQSTPREQRLNPDKTYAARIERGNLGGYKMYVEGAPRMIRVVRVQ